MLVEQAHRVAHVRDRLRARLDAGPRQVVARPGVPNGRRDPNLGQGTDQIRHARDLGRQRGVKNVPAGRLLVLLKQADIGLVHKQVFGHGALVLAGKARALQVDAQKSRPVVSPALDDLARLADTPQRLLGSISQNRAKPPGHTLAGKEPPDRSQVLFARSVDVMTGRPVSVDVDEARQDDLARCVDHVELKGVVVLGRDAGNVPRLDRHVSPTQCPVAQHPPVGDIQRAAHRVPPLVSLLSGHVVDVDRRVGVVLQKRDGESRRNLAISRAPHDTAVPIPKDAQANLARA